MSSPREYSVHVHRCVPNGDDPGTVMRIYADQIIPQHHNKLAPEPEYVGFYSMQMQQDAEKVVNALTASLPGGTMDRILCTLLARKASIFVVADRTGPERAIDACLQQLRFMAAGTHSAADAQARSQQALDAVKEILG